MVQDRPGQSSPGSDSACLNPFCAYSACLDFKMNFILFALSASDLGPASRKSRHLTRSSRSGCYLSRTYRCASWLSLPAMFSPCAGPALHSPVLACLQNGASVFLSASVPTNVCPYVCVSLRRIFCCSTIFARNHRSRQLLL